MRTGADGLFLRACGVAQPDDWAGAEASLLGLAEPQWALVARHATTHGLVGLIARNLEWAAARTGARVPVMHELSERRRGLLVQQLNRKAAGRRAGDALVAAGIPFIAFKGVVLAEEIYGDLSARAFHDLDLMVQRENLDAAFEVLRTLGYRLPHFAHVRDWVRCKSHAVGMSHPDGFGLDLHWSISPDVLDEGRIAMLWEHARPAPTGAHLPGLRLSPEMTLVHLAKHFHANQYCLLKPLVDFHFARRHFAAEVDAASLESVARGLRLLAVLQIAARVGERCFGPGNGLGLPSAARSMHARIANAVVTDEFLLHYARHSRLTNWLRFLAASGSLGATLRSVAGFLFPGRLLLTQFFARPYEPRMYPVYYWRQVKKILTLSTK